MIDHDEVLSPQELQVAEDDVQEIPFEEVSTVPVLLFIEPSIVKNLLFPKVTPMRLDVVPDDLLSQEVPSDEVRIVPGVPTATYNPEVVVVVVLTESSSVYSSLSPQEMMRRLKINTKRIMSKYLIGFLIG